MTYQQKIAIPIRLATLLKRETRAGRMKKGSADKAAVLVRELMKHSFRNDLHGNWINLHSRKLFELIGKKTYVQLLTRLERLGVIYRTKSFYAGNGQDRGVKPFPKALCLNRKYGSHKQCEFWTLSSSHSINAVQQTYNLNPRTDTARTLAEIFPEFELRISGDDYSQAEFKSVWNLENIDAIQRQKYFLTEDNTSGRLHSSFTQLTKATRQKLFTENRSVASLDVSAMQPLLIGWAIREGVIEKVVAQNDASQHNNHHSQHATNHHQPDHTPHNTPHTLSMCPPFFAVSNCYESGNDVKLWIADCENQQIYERLQSMIPTNRQKFEYRIWGTNRRIPSNTATMTRKQFKRLVLQVIFDRTEQTANHPVWQAIESHYPTIARGIQLLKSGKGPNPHKAAAKFSQIWEVEIMIHKIAAEHIRRGIPIITIHDEIVTPSPDVTRRIMKQEFANIGLNPAIH